MSCQSLKLALDDRMPSTLSLSMHHKFEVMSIGAKMILDFTHLMEMLFCLFSVYWEV